MADVNLVHCSFHKCLTVYYGRVMSSVFNRCLPWSRGYRHFNSHLRDFYGGFRRFRVTSVNNRFLDPERLGDCRISRFVRDPRDLVVSGYFYHRRGAEAWTRMVAPTPEDWYFANGVLPEGMKQVEISFSDYLQSISEEEGLLAELEFRRSHFESMARWPTTHPKIVTYRYEDIIGSEPRVFRELFDFYEFSAAERKMGEWFVRRYSIRKRVADAHVRNPNPGQWRTYFTPRLARAFDEQHPGLIQLLGYSSE